jgi:hypothetical protein
VNTDVTFGVERHDKLTPVTANISCVVRCRVALFYRGA